VSRTADPWAAVPGTARPALRNHLALLGRWNRRVDLVAPADEATWLDAHVHDSLQALEALPDDVQRVVDVGSGAGFPGLVWALVRPELSVTLCEARGRRVAFLREVLRQTRRRDVVVEATRAEELAPGGFDAAVSRAVLPFPRWLPVGARLVRPGGVVLALLGPEGPDDASPAEESAGLSREAVVDYRLPGSGKRRQVVVLRRPG